MLTIAQLEIYKKYNGDQDALSRCGTQEEKKILNDSDFRRLDKFISDLSLDYQGLASENFISNLEQELKNSCRDREVVEELRKVAKEFFYIKVISKNR